MTAKKYATDSERQAAHRERNGLRQLNVLLPADVADALDAYVKRRRMDAGMTKAEVVAHVLRTQLLRKR